MANTYTCDKCGVVLTHRSDAVGAHRLKIVDVIPWVETSTHGSNVRLPDEVDLCDACCIALRDWLTTPTRVGGSAG